MKFIENATHMAKEIKEYAKVDFHCLTNLHQVLFKESIVHQHCSQAVQELRPDGKYKTLWTKHFCSCGYNTNATVLDKFHSDMEKMRNER